MRARKIFNCAKIQTSWLSPTSRRFSAHKLPLCVHFSLPGLRYPCASDQHEGPIHHIPNATSHQPAACGSMFHFQFGLMLLLLRFIRLRLCVSFIRADRALENRKSYNINHSIFDSPTREYNILHRQTHICTNSPQIQSPRINV